MDKPSKMEAFNAIAFLGAFVVNCVALGFLIYDPTWIRFATFVSVGVVTALIASPFAKSDEFDKITKSRLDRHEDQIRSQLEWSGKVEARFKDIEAKIASISLGRLR